MGHRAAMYSVRVREKGYPDAEPRLLGDIDEAGTGLLEVLRDLMDEFESVSEDGTKAVRSISADVQDDELLVMLQHGQTGVAADIVDGAGALRIHQDLDDSQLLRCGVLFDLPRDQRIGWVAVHINNGRGVKGLLVKGIVERFRAMFDDLKLEVRPHVLESVLTQAVREDRIEKVKLVRLERPEDRAISSTDKWIPAGVIGRIELDISTRGDGNLITKLLKRFVLRNEQEAFDEIVEFEGMEFDEARVEVSVTGRGHRTFNIEHPDSGHAVTEELEDIEQDESGEPIDESVFAALRGALTSVVS